MDQIKIGRFISSNRKDLGMTQAELAEKLGVSDKSVSKWERGVCLPDVSLYQDLCSELGITINEFFAGERLENEEIEPQSEKNIMDIAQDGDNRSKRQRMKIVILAVVAVMLAIGIIVAVHTLKSEGHFMSNYLRAYTADADGEAVIDIMKHMDEYVSLVQYDVDESYSNVSITVDEFLNGEKISEANKLKSDFVINNDELIEENEEMPDEARGSSGIIAVFFNQNDNEYTLTISDGSSKMEISDIPIVGDADGDSKPDFNVNEMDSWTQSMTTVSEDPVSIEKGEEIPIVAYYLSENNISAIVQDMVEESIGNGETLADYVVLVKVKFE